MKSLPPLPLMVSWPPRPRMQSAPMVPFNGSLFDVPTMMFVPAGQHEGSSPSWAVTCWVAVLVLPRASRAVQVTTIVPSGKRAGALLVMVTVPPQSSCANAWPRLAPVQLVMVMSGGTTVKVGPLASVTVMFWVALPVFPAPSVADQVMVCGPMVSGNSEARLLVAAPSGGMPHSSVRVAVPSWASVGAQLDTVVVGGAVTTGLMPSEKLNRIVCPLTTPGDENKFPVQSTPKAWRTPKYSPMRVDGNHPAGSQPSCGVLVLPQ